MKKAQAAMDFIITYGWAIFLVFAVIGALAYFGILSPEKFKGQECFFIEQGIKCISHAIGPGTVSLSLENSRGMEIIVNNIKINECSAEFSKVIPFTANEEFQIPCQTGASSSKFKAEMEVTYTENQTGFSKKATGILKSRVE